jgi:hypothetical protein
MMKAHVTATIKWGGVVVRLPKSNHGYTIGYKDGRVLWVSTNLVETNGFKKLKGLVELAYGETNMRDAGSEVVVGSHFENKMSVIAKLI